MSRSTKKPSSLPSLFCKIFFLLIELCYGDKERRKERHFTERVMINRREFLKSGLITGLAMAVSNGLNVLLKPTTASEKVDLVVAQGFPPARVMETAIRELGGIRSFIARGDIVVIKPNIGWDRRPEQAANTNPEVVSSLVTLCYDAGAKTVKVFDRSVDDPRRCYAQSGIADAATAAGGKVSFIDDRKFKTVKVNGLALKEWPLYSEILDADRVINVPIAKTHGLAQLTMAMKNWMGVMGSSRGRIHQRLDECLPDIASVIKPTLTVLDAMRILTANGPQGGNLKDVKQLNTIVMSRDQVAVDAFGATLFGLQGSDLGYVRTAARIGLGTMDLSQVVIKTVRC
jgi:uncharacterized protein (DUF362 family)